MRPPAARRAVFCSAAALATGLLLAAALAAETLLGQGRVIDLWVIQLRLTHNAGVAFGIGAGLPGWAVLAVPAAITVAVAFYGWRQAPVLPRPQLAAMAAILAGAAANVIDRAGDGVVTDYLHTGWWPTFNLPDAFIVCGAALLVLTGLRQPTRAAPASTKR
jgi:signal peptidase II